MIIWNSLRSLLCKGNPVVGTHKQIKKEYLPPWIQHNALKHRMNGLQQPGCHRSGPRQGLQHRHAKPRRKGGNTHRGPGGLVRPQEKRKAVTGWDQWPPSTNKVRNAIFLWGNESHNVKKQWKYVHLRMPWVFEKNVIYNTLCSKWYLQPSWTRKVKDGSPAELASPANDVT